jgi:hypothetical protein
LIGNMPDEAHLSFDVAHELLCARSYVIGLLSNLGHKGVFPHPSEAMFRVLEVLLSTPEMMLAVCKWNRQRYLQERGPARVGGTRYAEALGKIVKADCLSRRPTIAECRMILERRMREAGFGALVDSARAHIIYDSDGEITSRTISKIQLVSGWPQWAVYLIDPTTFMTVSAYCHLRSDGRTFNFLKMESAVAA